VVRFPVDDVLPVTDPLPTAPLGELHPEAIAVGGDPALPVLAPDGVHPLLHAVGRAFADHRPLALSPDVEWLTIAQGVAQHIRLHAERLRPLLVDHAGRKRLEIMLDGPMPRDAASWHYFVGQYAKQLDAEIADAGLFACDFTTSTDVERTAARIVLLDAYSPYFALWPFVGCGIPTITLTGTADDWRTIRARIDELPKFGLEDWCRSLAPIADQFVRAACGDVDTAFWQRVYNPADAYGGKVVTGWIARLYPYLNDDGTADRPNPLLELPIDEPRDVTVGGGLYVGTGVRPDDVPAALSRAVVHVNDPVGGRNLAVALHGGVVAVAQDDDGTLRPVAGWHLAPAAIEIDDVIDRIEREHTTAPPGEPFYDGPAELAALYHRFGSATLFDGRWRLPPAPLPHRRTDSVDRHHQVGAAIDLPDGRCIAWVHRWGEETTHWVICRIEEVITDCGIIQVVNHRFRDDPADVPVYGTSLAMLLEAALDSGGDIEHLRTGRLSDLVDPRDRYPW
jgi:hypothetical protein